LEGHVAGSARALEADVMTLVNDQMAVLGHAVINHALPDEILNDGDVEQPGRPASAAAVRPRRCSNLCES
jgi:hypothetical protein